MAGTIPLSMTQQLNEFGEPLSGGQLYIIQVGTVSTPQNAFQDTGLTITLPYPMTLDAAGRVPQFFLADGSVKVRLQDASGVVQLAADSVLVIGASSGGGGGGSVVDPSTIFQTGDVKARYGIGVHPGVSPGWVRCNGLTIGNSTAIPAATERGNADTQALFLFLWSADANLTVSGGRGGSAAADWTAGKTIALPDGRGRGFSGLDDMGNVAANRLTATYFGASAIVLGATGGAENITLSAAQSGIAAHQHPVFIKDPQHHHALATNVLTSGLGNAPQSGSGGGTALGSPNTTDVSTGITIGSVSGTANDNVTANVAAAAASAAHRTVQPTILVTYYMKL